MQRSCTNAFSLYKRTRPPAAPESVARAKALPKEGVHPLLAAQVPVTSGTGLEAQVGLNSAVLCCAVQRHTLLSWKVLSCCMRSTEEPLQIQQLAHDVSSRSGCRRLSSVIWLGGLAPMSRPVGSHKLAMQHFVPCCLLEMVSQVTLHCCRCDSVPVWLLRHISC